MIDKIKKDLNEISKLIQEVSDKLSDKILEIADLMVDAYKNKGTVYFFGNGGSAADSQHLAAELVCRFKKERKALPAIALTTDTSFLTAASNDFDFSQIFERQVEAFVKPGDIAIGISTSGNSENVLKGLEKAKALGAKTVALLGCSGGNIKNVSDISLVIPSSNTPRIQECHILIGHIICDIIEQKLFV